MYFLFILKVVFRYFSFFGFRFVLVLKIREGVYLLVEDKILDVLFSNEEVMVFVEFWDLLVLFERYRDVCINVNISK